MNQAATPGTTRRTRIVGAVVVAMTLAVWTAAFHQRFTSIWYPDACDYAQLGRQIARGEGMTTRQSFPYVLSWLREHGHPTEEPWPNITRFVLPPLERAASFALFGVNDTAALLPDALFLAAIVGLCFALGTRMAGAEAGWSAAMVVMTSPTILQYAVSGLSETGAAFFLLACAFALARLVSPGEDDAASRRWALLLGAAIGFGFLQRSNLGFGMAPAVAVLLAQAPSRSSRRRFELAATCGAVAAVVVSPWLLRNAVAFGSPLISLTVERGVAIYFLHRDPFYDFSLVSSSKIIADHLSEVIANLSPAWLLTNWRDLFGSDLAFFVPAMLATPLVAFAAEGRAVSRYLWGTLLLTWILSAPIASQTEARFWQPFAPLCVVLVTAAAATLLRRVHAKAGPALLAVASTALAVAWTTSDFAGQVIRRDPSLAAWDRAIAESVDEKGVVASDQSWYVAWQADRPSVRFYGNADQLAELEKIYTPVAAVWLSRASTAAFESSLATRGESASWRLVKKTPDGNMLWLKQAPAAASGSGH